MFAVFRTSPTPLPTLARLAVGLILFVRGAAKTGHEGVS